MNYQDINAETIDRWIEEGWEWGKPISHEEFEVAKNGDWDVKLTPTKYVPHSWFGDLRDKKILGLASGAACRDYFKATGRRISFEYAMIRGVNDSPEAAGL